MSSSIVGGAKLEAAAKGYKALFFSALERESNEANTLKELLSMEVPSTGSEENYNWLGDVPGMQEWIGERPISKLKNYGYTIKNKTWANGLTIRAEDVEDDKLTVIRPRIVALAEEAAHHKLSLITDLLNGGFASTCYDGQYFFDSDHVSGNSGSISNVGGSDLSITTYATAVAAMRNFKNDEGKSLRINPTHLFVSPTFEAVARQIAYAEQVTSGVTNIWRSSVTPVVLPEISDADSWFLMDLSKPLKPFISQTRRPVDFRAMDNPNDQDAFMRNEFYYGADYRGNAGYGLWQLAYGNTGA